MSYLFPDECSACAAGPSTLAQGLALSGAPCPVCGAERPEYEAFRAWADDELTRERIGADWSSDVWHVAGDLYLCDDDSGESVDLVARNVDDDSSEPWPIREGIPLRDVPGWLPALRRMARMMDRPRDLGELACLIHPPAWLADPEAAEAYLHRRWGKADDDEKGDLFSLASALYWHCVEWHRGMRSPRYRVSCTLGYTPGAFETGVDPDDWAGVAIKELLDAAAGGAS